MARISQPHVLPLSKYHICQPGYGSRSAGGLLLPDHATRYGSGSCELGFGEGVQRGAEEEESEDGPDGRHGSPAAQCRRVSRYRSLYYVSLKTYLRRFQKRVVEQVGVGSLDVGDEGFYKIVAATESCLMEQ